MVTDFFKGIEKDNSPWCNFSWEPTFASFGIYTRPLAYPQALHFKGRSDRTYIVYQDRNFNSAIIFFDHDEKKWSDPTIIGVGTIGTDDHGAPSLAIDQGYLFVFYGAHNSPIKVGKSTYPEDITSWENLPCAGIGSYPQPYIRSDGEIHLFYRGDRKSGDSTRPCIHRISTDHGHTWTREETIIEFKNWGIYPNICWGSDTDVSIAWFKWDVFGPGSIDLRYDVYFIKSNDSGKTWKKADDSVVSLPVDEHNADIVFQSYPQQAYVWDLQVSCEGVPFILFTTGTGADANYMVAFRDQQSWQIRKITSTHWIRNAGVIDIRNPSCIDVYLIKGHFSDRGGELQRYSSNDRGVTWAALDSLMTGSDYRAWAMQVVKDYHPDLKIIWGIGNKGPGHIVFEGTAPQRVKIPRICPPADPDPSESLDYYKKMPRHPAGIEKSKIPKSADIHLGDAALAAFYSERYADTGSTGLVKNRQAGRLSGVCTLVKPGEFFLDAGCGDGEYMEALYQRDIYGIGLDLAVTNILWGRIRFPHLKFIHGFVEEIPFSDNYFDIVILSNGIGHFRQPAAVLSECLRAAQTGLVIFVPADEEDTIGQINPVTLEGILALLDRFRLNVTWYTPQGEIIPKETAVSALKEFPGFWLRAEKSEESYPRINKYVTQGSLETEARGKTELLDNDQWKRGDFHARDSTELARFSRVSQVICGNRVLEIGSGNGDSTLVLSKTGWDVVGIDISAAGIWEARRYSLSQKVTRMPEFQVMDATALAFPDNTFDTVIIPEVLEHVKSSRKIIKEAIRVVRNGGRIIISVPDGLLVPWDGHLRIFFKDTLMTELSPYTDTISWHDLPFRKWIIGSFFVNKDHPALASGPVVDILMPVYNGKPAPERAIRSVIYQTYTNWNLIVLNDGDDTVRDCIGKFHDPRIKYISTGEDGEFRALDTGLRNSSGEYITYLDDEILYPIHLEELVTGVRMRGADAAYTDWYEVSYDSTNTEFLRGLRSRGIISTTKFILRNDVRYTFFLHSRALLTTTGWYDNKDHPVLIDGNIIRRLALKAGPVHIRSVTRERILQYDNDTLLYRITCRWIRYKRDTIEPAIRSFSGKFRSVLNSSRFF